MKEVTTALINGFFEKHPDLECIRAEIVAAIELWKETYTSGHKMLLCGNGGSCSDCEHIVGELMKGFLLRRPTSPEFRSRMEALYGEEGSAIAASLQQGLPAIALTNHSAAISAFANDVNAEYVYAQQVLGYGCQGDLLVGISTSGNARNVNDAIKTAKALGIGTMGLTGKTGGALLDNCDICIVSPEQETYKIQEHHLAIYHLLCAATEYELFDC